ncbi:MAG TPA: exodeoxyribonuclease V subunit gamma [Rheinheimera sp.]|nr:exodeoxyribonuclease V subunit gamma [Rheinheimera sp.]
MSLMEPTLEPGFLVVHANQAEMLRDIVVQWLKRYPLGVFETETLLVQSNGIAQWLKLALASQQQGLGIAAGLSLQMPGRFVWQLYRTLLPDADIPEQSPLDKAPLQWRLFALLPRLMEQAAYEPLQRYLQGDDTGQKRSELAGRLADLFDQYQVYRADWLAAWQQGQDVLIDARGQCIPLSAQDQWQAQLWRDVLADVGEQHPLYSRAQLHQQVLDAAKQYSMQQRPAGLPRRLVVFGLSSLPYQTLQALAAIAPYTQIVLTVHNPCQYYWADIVADPDLLKASYKRQSAKNSPLTALVGRNPGHPLLAAWGKQGRDYIRLLDEFDQTQQHLQLFQGQRVDLFEARPSDHLLGQLQDDILNLRTLEETRQQWAPLTSEQCRSVQFATAHSVLREIEVLHNDLLQQFEADPKLQYRDVMVMVPDIAQYSAAIHAVFGRFEKTDPRYIPFTIADQAQQHEQPMLRALRYLLNIRRQRFGLSELLDLIDVPAVANRFGLSEIEREQCKDWLQQAGARLGLHAAHQQQQGIHALDGQHSMWFALQRMLLGYAFGDNTPWLGIVPYAAVKGLDAAAAGKLADCLAQLDELWLDAALCLSASQWQQRLLQVLEQWFVDEEPEGQELLQQLRTSLVDCIALMQAVAITEPLSLDVIADAWLAPFDNSSLPQRFLAGAVNFATLMPMRAIPFRQVHLLGMNDGAFPRQVQKQDFDLMSQHYRPGDRSRRDDDRYLLLEALLSARERLRISWLGRDKFDNSPLEPSVLIAQLREHLSQGWTLENGQSLLTELTVEHPLQPFSRRYMEQLPSYHYEWQRFYQAKDIKTQWPLPARLPQTALALAALSDFVRAPVRSFFRQRLQVSFEFFEQAVADHETFIADSLELYQLRQQLVEQQWSALRQGQAFDVQGHLTTARQAGQLPPGPAGEALQHQLAAIGAWQWQQLQRLHQHSQPQAWPLLYQCHGVELRDVLQLQQRDGHTWQVLLVPDQLLKNKKYRLKPLIRPFVQLLAASSQQSVQQIIIAADGMLQWCVPSVTQANAILEQYIATWLDGLNRPLPIELSLAETWLTAKQQDQELRNKLAKQFLGEESRSKAVADDPYISRVFADFEQLWSSESEQLATVLYQPLLDVLAQATWQEMGE